MNDLVPPATLSAKEFKDKPKVAHTQLHSVKRGNPKVTGTKPIKHLEEQKEVQNPLLKT